MEPSPSGRDDQRKRRASEVFKVARNDLQQVAVSHEEAGSHHTSKYLKISRDNIGNDGTGAVREPNVWESDSGVMKWSGKRQNISVCETTEDEPGSEVHAMSVLAKILSLNVTSLVTSKDPRFVRSNSPSWDNARRIVMAQFFRENETVPTNASVKAPEKKITKTSFGIEKNEICSGGPWAPPAPYRSIKLSPKQTVPAHGSDRRVLIVDDSTCTRELVNQMLVHYGYQIFCAANGKLGFSMMQNRIYDMVFMDLEMPVMNGFHAVQAIRRWEKKVKRPEAQKICALSAHNSETEVKLSQLVGMQAFICKPFRRKDLYDMVEGNINQSSDFVQVE